MKTFEGLNTKRFRDQRFHIFCLRFREGIGDSFPLFGVIISLSWWEKDWGGCRWRFSKVEW